MSDLRYDPINNQWITIAGNRRERPMEFVPIEKSQQQLICPFCKGNEDETPIQLAAYRGDGSNLTEDHDPSDWLVRVVNNKYPSFSLNESAKPQPQVPRGPFQHCQSSGAQELIIPSPRHITSISELSDNELLLSFWVYQQRIEALKSIETIQHAMLFMNCRLAAGASLSHIHTQLIGSPVLGGRLTGKQSRNEQHVAEHGEPIIRAMINWEIEQETRIIELTENFCVVCPFASRFPFQIWIVPRTNEHDFCHCADSVRDELAMLTRKWICRFESIMESPAYNFLLHLEPFAIKTNRHWYVELFPRLTRAAGFEWGTDIWVNPISPESAARRLRVVD